MKYYLAFDQGEEYLEQERYVGIPLSLIDSSLDADDNFKNLCSFTMQYENESALKRLILTCLPEFRFYQNCSLVILKGKRHLGELVPYKGMCAYFNLAVLEDVIIRNIEDPEFRTLLLAPYSHIKYFAIVSNNLRRAGEIKTDYNYLRSCVRAFLTKVCMEGDTVDYRQVYKMAVFVMSDLGLLNNELPKESAQDFSEQEENSNSPIEFQREWLYRRARLRQLGQW